MFASAFFKSVYKVERSAFVFFLIGLCASCVATPGQRLDAVANGAQIDIFNTASSKKPFNAPEDGFQFVIVGDRTGGHRPGVFDRAMDQVTQMQPEFVIGVGDLIEGYTEDPAQLDEEWSEIERMVGKLDSPFFYVPGNHDISNNSMDSLWKERRGPAYYHFVYNNVLFLVLNTEDPPQPISEEMKKGIEEYKRLLKIDPALALKLVEDFQNASKDNDMAAVLPANISEQQLQYMQGAIASNPQVRWIFLFMHKPAWRYGSKTFAQLEDTLEGKPYTVLAGHEHYYTYEKRKGQHYIGMGKTGGGFHKPGAGDIDHIAWVTMTEDGPVIANIELSGVHDETGPPRAKQDGTQEE